MKPPADGWDRDEREAIDELQDELTSLQARHRGDPSLELLRAARHDALPPELQAAAERRLADDAWSRTLVEGLDDGAMVHPGLSAEHEDEILARMKKGASAPRKTAAWTWRPLLVGGAAAAAVIAAVWLVRPASDNPGSIVAPQPQSTTADERTTPRFVLALDKPDITLSLKALTWRKAGDGNTLLTDLKQPLDAFRRGDYRAADRDFAALESRYPDAVEVFFYGGISRLFLEDPTRAVPAFERASVLADDTFASRVGWYRAVAEERAGNVVEARRQLEVVCRTGGERAKTACDALPQLDSTPHAR
jgi:hypothetical protein